MKEIEKTIALEGGAHYTNDPADAGGETKFGIAKRSHPDVDIKNLTLEKAVEIYKEQYWNALHLDQYTFVPFRWKLFDISVNMGVSTATAFLQMLTKKKDTLDAVHELVELQMKRYVGIVIAKPQQLKFLRGWCNRAFETGEELI